jgi:uncharacterized repeat protein (TIGR01451 family)
MFKKNKKTEIPGGTLPAQTAAPAADSEPPRTPEEEAELVQELHQIYDTTGPEGPDMTHLEQAPRSTVKKILVGLVIFFAFLAAVSWAGFFFFSPDNEKFSGEGVAVNIDGPAQIKSGDLLTYEITYKNGERIPLGTASLQLRLPKEFVIQKLDPAPVDPTQLSWQIGSISPDRDGSVTVQGVVLAPLDRQIDLQAILTYRPADFNSEFQKVSTRTVGVADSVVGVAVSGPAKIMPGDKVVLDLSYLNTSESEFKKVVVRAVYPPNFIPETAEPASVDDGKTEWVIDSMPANTQGHIKVTGSFASDAKGKIDIKAQIGFSDENGGWLMQKEAVFTTDVLEGQLVVALILNGKTNDQSVSFGDTLHYAVTYRNTGSALLEDVTLTVVLDGQPDPMKLVQWNSLRDKQEGLRDGNKISWSKKQVTALGRIGSQEEGTINFDIPVAAAPLLDTDVKDYRVTSWVEAAVGKIDGETVNRTAQTPPFSAVFLSDAKLASEARYFNTDGLAVGSGPLPPIVGQTTTYRIFWNLANSLHDLSDLKISARLPSNVVWTGRSNVDAGELKFDAANEKLIWTLNWLPTSIKELKVNFDVTLTPTEDQAGKTPTVVDAAILEAADKATSAPIILSNPPLTTALEEDDLAAGKGKVLGQ